MSMWLDRRMHQSLTPRFPGLFFCSCAGAFECDSAWVVCLVDAKGI